jgi:PKD repeat protein
VDSGSGPYWEHDRVFVDGNYVGELTGRDDRSSISEFEIDPAWLSDNQINVKVDVDATYGHPDHADGPWVVQLGWSVLVVKLEWLPPVADFKAYPTEGIGPLTVHFKNLSDCASDYHWDFGDGVCSSDKHPRHTYNTVQKYYTVTLTARGCGGEDTMTKTNYIVVNKPVQVNFEATPLAVQPGDSLQFANNTGGNANRFIWDFGDGASLETRSDIKNIENPKHVYTEPGEYAVTLKAWGNGGDDELTIPGLVYVDAENQYLKMVVHSEGISYPGESWENALDHDIFGPGSSVGAAAEDAWAVLTTADDGFVELRKLRILVDTVEPDQLVTNLAKKFEIWAAPDETNFERVYAGELTQRDGIWEAFELETPVTTKLVKVVLTESVGEHAKYRSLAEIQFLGAPVSGSALNKPKAELASADRPTSFKLEQNYPNPFNPETIINYHLPEASQVTLAIYNVQGQLIRTLVNQNLESGIYRQVWDGRNETGETVGTGVYIYKLQAIASNQNFISFSKKMTLMK